MSSGTRIQPETLRSIDSATFTGSYQNLGTPLTHKASLVKFINNSDQLVTVSWFGGIDHDVFPMGSYAIYDVTSDKANNEGLYIPANTQFQVKGSAGTGSFYLIVLYQEGT